MVQLLHGASLWIQMFKLSTESIQTAIPVIWSTEVTRLGSLVHSNQVQPVSHPIQLPPNYGELGSLWLLFQFLEPKERQENWMFTMGSSNRKA